MNIITLPGETSPLKSKDKRWVFFSACKIPCRRTKEKNVFIFLLHWQTLTLSRKIIAAIRSRSPFHYNFPLAFECHDEDHARIQMTHASRCMIFKQCNTWQSTAISCAIWDNFSVVGHPPSLKLTILKFVLFWHTPWPVQAVCALEFQLAKVKLPGGKAIPQIKRRC